MTYTYTTSLQWGGDVPTAELDDIVVSYDVTWGAPERGPSYASGGQPADPDEIANIAVVSIDGKSPLEFDKHTLECVVDRIENEHWDALIDNAREQAAWLDDEEAEARRNEDIESLLAQRRLDTQP